MQKNAFFELFLQLLDSYLMYLVKERLRAASTVSQDIL